MTGDASCDVYYYCPLVHRPTRHMMRRPIKNLKYKLNCVINLKGNTFDGHMICYDRLYFDQRCTIVSSCWLAVPPNALIIRGLQLSVGAGWPCLRMFF